MTSSTIGLRQAIEAHFAEVDRLGIQQGKDYIVNTIIYIDNTKAFSVKSTRTKIGVCKIYDPRIKANLNTAINGVVFINSKYSYMFGYDQSSIISVISDLVNKIIPNCATDRITYENKKGLCKKYSIVNYVVALICCWWSVIETIEVEKKYNGGHEEDAAYTYMWSCIGLSIIFVALTYFIFNKLDNDKRVIWINTILMAIYIPISIFINCNINTGGYIGPYGHP